MIRINIPGFLSSTGGPRWGDCTIIDDGKHTVVIDGYCSQGKDLARKRLKKLGVKDPILCISHAHGDHEDGIYVIIKDTYFAPKVLYCYDPESLSSGLSNSEVKSDYNYLKTIIKAAKDRGIPVKYLKHGDHIVHGDIDFYVYREQPNYTNKSDDPHGWSFVNDGSLCFWFPTLLYWTSGDGPDSMYEMCKKVGAKPVWFKIPHHGNNCNRTQANGLKAMGAVYCWDNDYSTGNTTFLATGRKRCKEAGIKFFGIHGDINAVAYGGKMTIYKGGKYYSYTCPYNGASTLKNANLTVVEDVLGKKYGNDEARVTALLDAGFYPNNVQSHINKLISLLKG